MLGANPKPSLGACVPVAILAQGRMHAFEARARSSVHLFGGRPQSRSHRDERHWETRFGHKSLWPPVFRSIRSITINTEPCMYTSSPGSSVFGLATPMLPAPKRTIPCVPQDCRRMNRRRRGTRITRILLKTFSMASHRRSKCAAALRECDVWDITEGLAV